MFDSNEVYILVLKWPKNWKYINEFSDAYYKGKDQGKALNEQNQKNKTGIENIKFLVYEWKIKIWFITPVNKSQKSRN